MILADAGILIAYDRGKDLRLVTLVDTLPVGVCGTTRAEVVAGARTPTERSDTVLMLDTFLQVATPEAVWDRVGDHLAVLRAAGLKVPFPDAVVATRGLLLNVEVWARDPHFPAMAAHLPGLRLFAEPP